MWFIVYSNDYLKVTSHIFSSETRNIHLFHAFQDSLRNSPCINIESLEEQSEKESPKYDKVHTITAQLIHSSDKLLMQLLCPSYPWLLSAGDL